MASTKEVLAALGKCWVSRDQTRLVPDGDPSAAVLFARKGEMISRARVESFDNAGSFFPGVAVDAGTDEPVRRGPGRPRKVLATAGE